MPRGLPAWPAPHGTVLTSRTSSRLDSPSPSSAFAQQTPSSYLQPLPTVRLVGATDHFPDTTSPPISCALAVLDPAPGPCWGAFCSVFPAGAGGAGSHSHQEVQATGAASKGLPWTPPAIVSDPLCSHYSQPLTAPCSGPLTPTEIPLTSALTLSSSLRAPPPFRVSLFQNTAPLPRVYCCAPLPGLSLAGPRAL